MSKEDIIKRLIPITGFMDDKTGLLYIQTPTSSFGEFIELVIRNDKPDENDCICKCGHHSRDHSYPPNDWSTSLECDICECKDFEPAEVQPEVEDE